jgi:hypothetical protein
VQENGPVVVQASREDPRVTAIGQLLRSTSIDELPIRMASAPNDGCMAFNSSITAFRSSSRYKKSEQREF